jgi:hypothetical protein
VTKINIILSLATTTMVGIKTNLMLKMQFGLETWGDICGTHDSNNGGNKVCGK